MMGRSCGGIRTPSGATLRRFSSGGLDGLELYAVSTADATAEAYSNNDNQVYFVRGGIEMHPGSSEVGNHLPRSAHPVHPVGSQQARRC